MSPPTPAHPHPYTCTPAHPPTHTKHLQTLLSLSKLAMLTSESVDSETLQVLNRQLQLIELQQNIPAEALEVGCVSSFFWNYSLM